MKESLEKNEKKLRTSLKAKKHKPQGSKKEKEGDAVFKYHNSDDEEDEYFDRTKVTQFNKQSNNDDLRREAEVETYDSIKARLESLYKQR
jgi:hypothetical protein